MNIPKILWAWTNFLLAACGLVLVVSGCAKTVVKPLLESEVSGLPRPETVLVYDFAVSALEVRENQGIFARAKDSSSVYTQSERELDIGRQVAGALAEKLVSGIRELGLPVRRMRRGAPLSTSSYVLVVNGYFVNIDEGNRLRRLVIGFGAGGSKVDTQVQVYAVKDTSVHSLLVFTTHADSGKMPGAAATMGAGAAAQGGVTAGVAAANVAVGGVKVYQSEVERMAGRSADQAVAYLSEYFAKQGWISPSQVKKAKRAKE